MSLRSRLERPGRSQTSPNNTSSVSSTSLGAKSPINCCAGLGWSGMSLGLVVRARVLGVGDVGAPFGFGARFGGFPHGDVGHEASGCSAMPVPLAGRGIDDIARADLDDLAAA